MKGDPSALLLANFVVALPEDTPPDKFTLPVQLARIKRIHRNRHTISVRFYTTNAQTLKRAKWKLRSARDYQRASTVEISVDNVLVTFATTTGDGLIPSRFRQAIAYKLKKKEEGVLEWNRVVDPHALAAVISLETDATNIEEYADFLPVCARSQRLRLYPGTEAANSEAEHSESSSDDDGAYVEETEHLGGTTRSGRKRRRSGSGGYSSGSDDEYKPVNRNGDVVVFEDAFLQSTQNLGRTRSSRSSSSTATSQSVAQDSSCAQ